MIETTHKSYTIRFNEQEEVWICPELTETSVSLSTLKGRIDRLDSEARKIDSVRAYYSSYSSVELGTITGIIDGNHVWFSRPDSFDKKTLRRSKTRIDQLILATPEVDAAVAKAKSLRNDAASLSAAANNIISDLPTLTIQELRKKSA
jgi:hypothetical protein